MPTFSHRTNWNLTPNRLTGAIDLIRNSGKPLLDLTVSNPTECDFDYPSDLFSGFSTTSLLRYEPNPRGFFSVRSQIAEMYLPGNGTIHHDNIFLSAGTSESYSILFKLLCNPGDSILVPTPSYPLFEYLAAANDVCLRSYSIFYDRGWHIDMKSMISSASQDTKAIVLVHPHNPTGMFVKHKDAKEIIAFARESEMAIISDEVFGEYGFRTDEERYGSFARNSDCLTFTLNGLSKLCALPQVKLGWIVISGKAKETTEANSRLEIISDTFLSVNAPVQHIFASLMHAGTALRNQVKSRCKGQFHLLRQAIGRDSPLTLFDCEGGWYAIVRVPSTKTDEEWALKLLQNEGVLVYPGYFFDIFGSTCLVLSLITPTERFERGIRRIIDYIQANS